MLVRNYPHFREPSPVLTYMEVESSMSFISSFLTESVRQMFVYSGKQGVQREKFVLHIVCKSVDVIVLCQLVCLPHNAVCYDIFHSLFEIHMTVISNEETSVG